ncbi:MAG: hypothetical protein FJW32_02995 [Acidobacteria bacterium]|nr:hypothetical protein [Acidobacteriota bacterium]
MRYLAYLLCLGLITPAVAIGAMSLIVDAKGTGFFSAFFSVVEVFFFFLPGLSDPVNEGWRVLVWLAGVAVVFGIGAIRPLKTLAFWALGVLGTVGVAATLFAASREGLDGALVAALFLLPSIAGVVASMWFTVKFE